MSIRITPAVKALMIACFALFVVQHTADQFFGARVGAALALTPAEVVMNFQWWQVVTYAFLHADVMHLVLNLLMLAFIGGELEAAWGRAKFLRFYFVCVLVAGVAYLFLQAVASSGDSIRIPMMGASGAIYGLLMAYGLIFGERVMLFMMLFPMKAKHFVWVLAGVEFMTGLYAGGRMQLSSVAHLSGMAAGYAYLWIAAAWVVSRQRKAALVGRAGRPAKKRKLSSHLKLVINNDKDDDDDSETPKTWH